MYIASYQYIYQRSYSAL